MWGFRPTLLNARKVLFHLISNDEELYGKYHDKLPVFFVEDIYKEKYVDLEQTERNKTNEQR